VKEHAHLRNVAARIAGVSAVATLIATVGCGGSSSNSSQSANFGTQETVANGTATTYVTTNNASVPTAIGITVSKHALDNSPTIVNYPNAIGYDLPMPAGQSSSIPFRSVTLFTTAGHDPQVVFGQPGPYTHPHLHIAFSLYTTQQRKAIGARLIGLTPAVFEDPVQFPTYFDSNFDAPVDPYYVPINQAIHTHYIDYSSIPPGQELPTLGTVYFNPTVPEFTPPPNTGPFTTEVDYAYFAGSLSSFNISASLSQLVTVDGAGIVTSTLPINLVQPLDLPDGVQVSGYYPTNYSIKYDANRQAFNFELGGFVFRQATDPAGNPLPQARAK